MATPADVVWEMDRRYAIWSGELVSKGESWGWQANVLRSGEHVIGHRFILKSSALAWADEN